MAAMLLSSYTLLSRAPVLAPGPKFSSPSTAAALQLRKQAPAVAAAATAVVAVRWASGKESRSRRAPVFVCHAVKDYKDIQSNALQNHPVLETSADWRIIEDKDQLIIIKLNVGESTEKDQLKVETTDDLASLVIKYTGDTNGSDSPAPASELDLRLQLPHGYEGKKRVVKAKLVKGWLVVAVAKPNKHDPNQIFFHNGSFYYDANKIAIDD